jgi:DnaK suppressor protein
MRKQHSSRPITHAQIAALRERLLVERDVLRESTALPPEVVDSGDRQADPSDQATDSIAQHESLADRRRAREQLVDVDRALARIEHGTYGVSELSGEPIGIDRLTAIPWARLTEAEQEDLELAQRR